MKTEQKLKKTATTIKKKNLLGVEFVCLRHEIFTKSNVDKKSLTLCLRQLSLTVQRFSNKGNHLCRLGN